MRNRFLGTLLFAVSYVMSAQAQKDDVIRASTGWMKENRPKPQPVSFTWKYPVSAQTEQTTPVLVISLCAQTNDSTTQYQVFHQGKVIGGIRRGFKRSACDKEIKEEITLVPGSNEVYVIATNAAGPVTSEVRLVKYQPPAMAISGSGSLQKRIALVIANSDYRKSPLKNPVNDGADMKEELERLGFDVTFKKQQTLRELEETVNQFTTKLKEGNVGVVFYAGHGLMVNGDNYIQPVSADPKTETDVKYDCFPLKRLVEEMKGANPSGTNLVFWDACRNNPYRSWARGAGEPTYAQVRPPVGTMIIYATEPDKQAADNGNERNGLFTSELIKHISQPQVEINELIQRIDEGIDKRGFRQPPYSEGRLRGKFFFK